MAGAFSMSGRIRTLTPTQCGLKAANKTGERMYDPIAEAALEAAENSAPPKLWHVGPDAAVEFGNGPNPFDGMVLAAWSHL